MNYDQFMAALCLYREARSTSLACKTGIWHVLQNRVADPRWPNTLAEVVLQPKQFSSFNPGDPNSSKFPRPGPEWNSWLDCCEVILTPLQGDPTNGATNYESCAPDRIPAWAKPELLTVTIGPFRFYKL